MVPPGLGERHEVRRQGCSPVGGIDDPWRESHDRDTGEWVRLALNPAVVESEEGTTELACVDEQGSFVLG